MTKLNFKLSTPERCFLSRHIGPSDADLDLIYEFLGVSDSESLLDEVIPASLPKKESSIGFPLGEDESLNQLKRFASLNQVRKTLIGQGYHSTIIPPVILRTVFENQGWYTPYTPYQAELAQGRLEALLNYQTLVTELTGLPLANASLLDEPTAAAEAMLMAYSKASANCKNFIVADDTHPQTIEVLRGRAKPLQIKIILQPSDNIDLSINGVFGVFVQRPGTNGIIQDHSGLSDRVHEIKSALIMAADPLMISIGITPGELGADIAVGSMQRFGVPMGFGGPHAGYIACTEAYTRKLPGRIVGISRDSTGKIAYRLSIQTREQHIRRDKATSNICTAQALLAVISGFYAIWHGPEGIKRIASRVNRLAQEFSMSLLEAGVEVTPGNIFDMVQFKTSKENYDKCLNSGYLLRKHSDELFSASFDETTTAEDVDQLLRILIDTNSGQKLSKSNLVWPDSFMRKSTFLTQTVFNMNRSETEMLRYIRHLEGKDLTLCDSMIPLGSCTMKLNATTEMMPVSWPEFSSIHPFAPESDTMGYQKLAKQLEDWLSDLTGMDGVSLQPNAGSQGEYAGLLAIKAYHDARGESGRSVCLIPTSAHGTNPASAVVAGMKVVPVKCNDAGDIDLEDLSRLCQEHANDLGALMITYPSTHGVFEQGIVTACSLVHEYGGQVYLDGANMNAMVGVIQVGDLGADVCHLNLHKTFCIPHGGGGPGIGPIAMKSHLLPFAPSPKGNLCQVSGAPLGSASLLPIPWSYIAMMGDKGLKKATVVSIANANYMAKKISQGYSILYTGSNGRVAHEFIIDCREFEKTAGVRVEDIAKRLIDYGFHAPTMSWPVPGTLMVEPTESESKQELDRFCEALLSIREEIRAIEEGQFDKENNLLKHAPFPIHVIGADEWTYPFTRQEAAWPKKWLLERKRWSPVGRIDNAYGDRNLVCTCSSVEETAKTQAV